MVNCDENLSYLRKTMEPHVVPAPNAESNTILPSLILPSLKAWSNAKGMDVAEVLA
jgi:hypothetical protein